MMYHSDYIAVVLQLFIVKYVNRYLLYFLVLVLFHEHYYCRYSSYCCIMITLINAFFTVM